MPDLARRLTAVQRNTIDRIQRHLGPGTLFVVGGTIRDLLLGRPIKDIDVVIRGVPLTRLQRRLRPLGSVAWVGTRFGVLKFQPRGHPFIVDIALPRRERARRTGGYRDFSFRPDPHLAMEHDLARRDFTVNALALRWQDQTIIDPFNGARDAARKVLRAVGNPRERLSEDLTRILRLTRLACELGFAIESKTAAAARRLSSRLNARRNGQWTVAREALAEQLIRAFVAHPTRAFDECDSLGIFRSLIPEVAALRGCAQLPRFHSEGDVFQHTRLALQSLGSSSWRRAFPDETPSPLVVIAVLLHDIGKPRARRTITAGGRRRVVFYGHDDIGSRLARDIGERLRLASYRRLVTSEGLGWLIRHHLVGLDPMARALRPTTLLRLFSGGRGSVLLQLIWADQRASVTPSGTPSLTGFRVLKKRLATFEAALAKRPRRLVTGNELKRWFGLLPGPAIGELLERIADEQLSGRVRNQSQAKRFVADLLNTPHDAS